MQLSEMNGSLRVKILDYFPIIENIQFFLYGYNFTALTNFIVFNSAIGYILATKRFEQLLFL